MKVFSDGGRTVYRTVLGNKRATWELVGSVPRMLFIDDGSSGKPAYRYPDIPMPQCHTGHVAFDPENRPTLAQAIEMLPQYESSLWDAVRTELAVVHLESAGLVTCSDGRAFGSDAEARAAGFPGGRP